MTRGTSTPSSDKERKDGSGTVSFQRHQGGGGASGGLEKNGLMFVPDAAETEHHIASLERGESFGTGRRFDPSLVPAN